MQRRSTSATWSLRDRSRITVTRGGSRATRNKPLVPEDCATGLWGYRRATRANGLGNMRIAGYQMRSSYGRPVFVRAPCAENGQSSRSIGTLFRQPLPLLRPLYEAEILNTPRIQDACRDPAVRISCKPHSSDLSGKDIFDRGAQCIGLMLHPEQGALPKKRLPATNPSPLWPAAYQFSLPRCSLGLQLLQR